MEKLIETYVREIYEWLIISSNPCVNFCDSYKKSVYSVEFPELSEDYLS